MSYFDAYTFIRERGLRKYYFYSGLIGLAIFIFTGFLIITFSDDLSALLLSWLNIQVEWLQSASSFIVGILVAVLFFILFKYLILIITAPLMSKLSEEVESILDGDFIQVPFTLKQVLYDFSRALRLSIRNVIKEIGYTLLLLLIGLFPVFSVATTPFVFVVQAYYAGFGNIDFYAERHFDVKETIAFVSRHRGMAVGNGTLYVLLLAIPILGVFLAPTLGTVAATLESDRLVQEY